jgi:hypothetical protein
MSSPALSVLVDWVTDADHSVGAGSTHCRPLTANPESPLAAVPEEAAESGTTTGGAASLHTRLILSRTGPPISSRPVALAIDAVGALSPAALISNL